MRAPPQNPVMHGSVCNRQWVKSWLLLFFGLLSVLWLSPADLIAGDTFILCRREPGLSAQELAASLEQHGIPGSFVAQSPLGAKGESWRRITLEQRGHSGSRIHLFRMNRPPFLSRTTPELQASIESSHVCFGFLGPVSENGPAARLKALCGVILATRGNGFVYDGNRGQLFPPSAWEKIVAQGGFDYPAGVQRAVLRCCSVPPTPSETVSFSFIVTSFGGVAFDRRSLVRTIEASELPEGSVQAGQITTGEVRYRILDLEKELGRGKAHPSVRQYVLLTAERGGLAIPTDRLSGPFEVEDLQIELVPRRPEGLAELVIESKEVLPAGAPNRFLWLGYGGRGADGPQFDPLEVARLSLRGGTLASRENAVRAIGRIPGPEALTLLKEISRSGRGDRNRQLALAAMKQRPDGYEALLDLARNGRGNEGPEAVSVVASLQRPDTHKVLMELALSGEYQISSRIEALGKLRGHFQPQEVSVLVPLLGDPNSSLRILAADVILNAGPLPHARQTLVDELMDLRRTDLDRLVGALRRHKVKEALPALLERLPASKPPLRTLILAAVAALTGQSEDGGATDDSETVTDVTRRPNVQISPSPGSSSSQNPVSMPSVQGARPMTAATPGPEPKGAPGSIPTTQSGPTGLSLPLTRSVRVHAAVRAGLAPLNVLQFLSDKGFAVGLVEASAGRDASPVEWDRLKIKDQQSLKTFLEVTQVPDHSAGDGAAGIVYTVTCTIPEDPRLTRASAWLAWFLASRTKGTLVDASSRPQDLETWRRSLE